MELWRGTCYLLSHKVISYFRMEIALQIFFFLIIKVQAPKKISENYKEENKNRL